MEDRIIEQGAGAEPAPAAPAGAVSGMDGAAIVQQTGTETKAAPPTGESVGVLPEVQGSLSHEIRQLWAARRETLAAARRNKNEAVVIQMKLGKLLSDAKENLARPGRNGGWSQFARSLGISRTEADGLVRRYRGTLKPQSACTTVAEAATVTTKASQEAAGDVVPAQATDQASLSSGEDSATAGESPASALAADPAQQPSCGTPATVEEPAAESAAAPTEAGQAPAAADAGSGAVA